MTQDIAPVDTGQAAATARRTKSLVTVRFTVGTGSSTCQASIEIGTNCFAHCAGRTTGWGDAVLVEELDRSATHATAEHHLGALFANELRDLTRLMGLGEWVGDGLHAGHRGGVNIEQNKELRVTEVLSDRRFQTLIGLSRDGNPHY
jgi:hypothetical protein